MKTSHYISILLTYKNKLLLYSHDINKPDTHNVLPWSIFMWHTDQDWEVNIIIDRIEQLTSLLLQNIELLSSNDGDQAPYHAVLSDLQVNNMKRKKEQLLQFYTRSDLQKISLTPHTRAFFSQNQMLIKTLIK